MIARIIVQISSDGEKHVTLTQDHITPVEEFLVDCEEFQESKVVEGRLLILDMDENGILEDGILDSEMHSAFWHHPPITRTHRIDPELIKQLKEGVDVAAF
jgi:hypothetical protein